MEKYMTLRQRLLKTVYPFLMRFSNILAGRRKHLSGHSTAKASFYSLSGTLNNGDYFSFAALKGKKVMLVNTASDCGYTHQYAELEELYQKNKNSCMLLAFPANDFKEQEQGTDEEIAAFCKINYGVNFLLFKKSSVLKKTGQNPIFQWLSDPGKNGWNKQAPSWNFSKYLVNEEGNLTNYFGPSVSPLSMTITNALKK